MMLWREYLAGLAPAAKDGGPRLRPYASPANVASLEGVEAALGVRLPFDLRDMLAEIGGIYDEPAYLRLVLSTHDFLVTNAMMRSYIAKRIAADDLIIFAQAGNGDFYLLQVRGGQAKSDVIIEWDHESNSTRQVATSLRGFLRWWVTTRPWT